MFQSMVGKKTSPKTFYGTQILKISVPHGLLLCEAIASPLPKPASTSDREH